MSRNRLVAYVFGGGYLLIGVVGYLIVSDLLVTDTDKRLLLFEINGLHNVVHLLVGLALLGAARAGYRAARSMNLTVGATYLLIAVIGLFIANDNNDANILSLNGWDNVLHFATAAILLGVGRTEKDYVEGDRERDSTSIA
ncbi:MAG: DUF4383 domain-containing protein [Mycobacteriales bacterium]